MRQCRRDVESRKGGRSKGNNVSNAVKSTRGASRVWSGWIAQSPSPPVQSVHRRERVNWDASCGLGRVHFVGASAINGPGAMLSERGGGMDKGDRRRMRRGNEVVQIAGVMRARHDRHDTLPA